MTVLVLKMTDAGLAAVQAASGSDPTTIAEIGLTDTDFDYAPTLTALPGEFKRVDVLSGVAAAPNITHLTAYDTSADVWTARGLGLYLDDGTLFGVCNADEALIAKAGVAFALLVFDIAFEADLAANIAYGNATFVWPPATESMQGVAKLATQGRVDAEADGFDDAETIVTPKTLRARLAAFVASVAASLAALTARQILGGGLVTGGGNLSADRTLTVTEASAGQITAGTATDVVVTPRRLGPIAVLLATNGYLIVFGVMIVWGRFAAGANTSTTVTFPLAFSNQCCSVVISGAGGGGDAQDNWPATLDSSITANDFAAFSAADGSIATSYIAVGY